MADGHIPDQDASGAEHVPVPLVDTPVPEAKPAAAPGRGGGSRLTRVLLGVLLLAFAVFIWVNYAWLPGQEPDFTAETPVPVLPRQDAPPAAAVEPDAGPRIADLPALADAPDAGPGSPEAPAGRSFVAPDLVVTDLPLLVTAPPPADAEADEPAEAVRSRAQLLAEGPNPFSPVHLAMEPGEFTPPAIAEQLEPPAPAEEIIEVSIPSGPGEQATVTAGTAAGTVPGSPAVPAAPQLPAPPDPVPVQEARAAALPPAEAATATPAREEAPGVLDVLPRPLPGPALAAVPSILQEHRSPRTAEPRDPATAVALTEPEAVPSESVTERHAEADVPLPEALPPVAQRIVPAGGDPLVAGVTPLSRYLRDNDVTFTGLVLGPISHGVFHLSNQPRPVVLALGRQLPDTEITLTDLKGQQAEFTLADSSQSLTLDLGR